MSRNAIGGSLKVEPGGRSDASSWTDIPTSTTATSCSRRRHNRAACLALRRSIVSPADATRVAAMVVRVEVLGVHDGRRRVGRAPGGLLGGWGETTSETR